MISNSHILTIAIPTYNRSRYLNQCLSILMPQVAEQKFDIVVHVFNNHSTDDTDIVTAKYLSIYGNSIIVTNNSENIGGDRNILKCYNSCNSKYVWILGDDDVVMPGALTKIIPRLKEAEYGIVYLKPFPYEGDPFALEPKCNGRYDVYSRQSSHNMIYEISDMFAFISGNIVNKDLVDLNIETSEFIWTRINQLLWHFSAFFSASSSMYIDDALIAVNNEGQSGRFPFCQVIGVNFNVIFKFFNARGVHQRYFDIINKRMSRELIAPIIYYSRKIKGFRNYTEEDHYQVLKPDFKKYLEFWLFVVPMSKLPITLLYPYFVCIRIYNRIHNFIRSIAKT